MFVVRTTAIVILVAVGQYVFNSETRVKHDELRNEVQRMSQETAKLGDENERLKLEIDAIQRDERYLRQMARHEYGMIEQGEVLYRFIK